MKSLTVMFRECEKRIEAFLEEKRREIAPDIPEGATKLYKIAASKRLIYSTEEWDITDIIVLPKFNRMPLYVPGINKRASRKDLDGILEFENKIKGEDITFSVLILISKNTEMGGKWLSSADYERDFIANHNCAFSPEALQP